MNAPPTGETQASVQEFQVGNSRIRVQVSTPSGTTVSVSVGNGMLSSASNAVSDAGPFSSDHPYRSRPAGIRQVFTNSATLITSVRVNATAQTILLVAAVSIYLIIRLVRLPDFPIYFFTDEAVQTVLAQDLVNNGWHGYDHQLLPTFFVNGNQYNLGVSVYAQVIPYLLFGKSVWVTRGVSVLFSLLAAVAVGLTLKEIFKARHAWTAVLLLSATPAWFLHSRTAFETAIATSLFAIFIYYYLKYRVDSPRYLTAALIAAGLMFYAYSPARLIIGVMGLLLLLNDLPFHWKNRKEILKNLLIIVIIALPLIRFQLTHSEEFTNHLRILNSYWIQPISTQEKFIRFFTEYAHGLNPAYWFIPNDTDFARHLMKNYGHLLPLSLAFFLVGLGLALRKIRASQHRVLLLAVLAAPTGAALVGLGITRALSMVIPAVLISALGLCFCLEWVQARWKIVPLLIGLPVFVLLGGMNLWMLNDALTNGPTWFDNYSLGGMQYGADQIFRAIDDYHKHNPDQKIILSPSWANGTDVIVRFFYDNNPPFELGSIDGYFDRKLALDEKTTFIMIPEEFDRVTKSDKFTAIQVVQTIPYPNGSPGFIFAHLRYVDNIDAILEAESQARRILKQDSVLIDGKPAEVHYSFLDMGEITLLFDHLDYTLVRTMEANPFQAQIFFQEPRTFQQLDVRIGGVASRVMVEVYDSSGKALISDQLTVKEDPNPRTVSFQWSQAYTAARVDVAVLSVHDSEPAHVHVWGIDFK
jgi:hypothetical protein